MPCDSPYFIKLTTPRFLDGKFVTSVNVACGKCQPCLKRRVNQWAFRLIQEDKRSTSAYFITLTYDTEHVPLTSRCNMTLRKKDLQNFFKRLRYHHEKDGIYLSEIKKNNKIERKPIKYYACGEYGGLFGRPHYHAIIFNAFPDNFEKAWSECIELPSPSNPHGKWQPIGNIQYREADTASIFYTLKYMDKRESNQWSYDDELIKEFSIKSKGLGDNYITPESLNHHSSNLDNNYVMSGNHKIALPRYYNKKFWPDSLDENGFISPHPYKTKLLHHIKNLVNDTTDKLRALEGDNYERMESIRKKARFSKISSPFGRKF